MISLVSFQLAKNNFLLNFKFPVSFGNLLQSRFFGILLLKKPYFCESVLFIYGLNNLLLFSLFFFLSSILLILICILFTLPSYNLHSTHTKMQAKVNYYFLYFFLLLAFYNSTAQALEPCNKDFGSASVENYPLDNAVITSRAEPLGFLSRRWFSCTEQLNDLDQKMKHGELAIPQCIATVKHVCREKYHGGPELFGVCLNKVCFKHGEDEQRERELAKTLERKRKLTEFFADPTNNDGINLNLKTAWLLVGIGAAVALCFAIGLKLISKKCIGFQNSLIKTHINNFNDQVALDNLERAMKKQGIDRTD